MEIILKYFSDFTSWQIDQLKALEDLYKEWNKKINVISRRDMDGLYEKHVLHSLSIAAFFEFQTGTEIIDLGTGGGFPAIPLAVFFPDVKFHLVDSIAKKLKVVDAIAKEIGLVNISTQHIRAEEIKTRRFDFVVTRAVAPLKDLWKWSKPLLRKSRESGVWSRESGNNPDLPALDSGLQTPDSRLPTPNSRLPTPDSRLKTPGSGLICLKGGDLVAEIKQSGVRPLIMAIHEIFPEEYFREKFILFVTD